MPIKVALVSGSWPPDLCGVGDYAALLAEAMEAHGVEVHRIAHEDWSWKARRDAEAKIRRATPDILHVQYPTRGFGASRIPAWLMVQCRDVRRVMTLHEYTAQVGPPILGLIPRGLPHYLPFSLADALIFSSEHEAHALARVAPWTRRKTHLFPIASNIARGRGMRKALVVHFGQICPNKGVEDFLQFCSLLEKHGSVLPAALVGSVPKGFEEWAGSLLANARAHGVHVLTGMLAPQVADTLATARYAYLPFPDGASAKRGSLLAALLNGVCVVTRHGPGTPEWIRRATLHADNPEDAVSAVLSLESDPARRALLEQRARKAGGQVDWSYLAGLHVQLYTSLLQDESRAL